MTEAPARGVAGAGPWPPAEPQQRVGRRWIALIALANLGLYLAYLGPISVLLPDQVQAIAVLVTQVLPSAAGRAKDLGLINIANSGPQVLAPAIAAPLVSQLGGYRSLYLSVAVITVLGSLFVQRIRSVP